MKHTQTLFHSKNAWKSIPLLLLLSTLFLSCGKDEGGDPVATKEVPTVTTKAITAITPTTATSGGNITADGGDAITAKGVVWGTATNPTTDDSKTTDGTGTDTFTSNLTNLTAGTEYFVRAYATNSVGTSYGNEVTFTTTEAITAPVLTTTAVTAITRTTATSGGNITSNGGATITARGIVWSTATAPTLETAGDSKTTDGTDTETFARNLTNLTAGTEYYIRAYATNSVGTNYGNELTFTTEAITVPALTTTEVTAITKTTATSGGSITSDGGAEITARGIVWSTTANPTTADNKTTEGTDTETFARNLTNLTADMEYYVRAYATNSAGTGYGNEITFRAKSIFELHANGVTVIAPAGMTAGTSGPLNGVMHTFVSEAMLRDKADSIDAVGDADFPNKLVTTGITDMSSLFSNDGTFNGDIRSWDVSSVTNMDVMFSAAAAFNQDIGAWNVSSVTNMGFMFNNAQAFNRDLSGWCVTNITGKPGAFDAGTNAWTDMDHRPVWGTCP